MAPMPNMSRRNALRLGVGAAAGAAGAVVLGGLADPRISSAAPPATQPTMVTGSFVSAARGGVNTNWAIARPPGQTAPLRPVIALHGKGSDAATVMAGGVEQGLAEAVQAGLPPFAVVAVDGGGSYHVTEVSSVVGSVVNIRDGLPTGGASSSSQASPSFSGPCLSRSVFCAKGPGSSCS